MIAPDIKIVPPPTSNTQSKCPGGREAIFRYSAHFWDHLCGLRTWRPPNISRFYYSDCKTKGSNWLWMGNWLGRKCAFSPYDIDWLVYGNSITDGSDVYPHARTSSDTRVIFVMTTIFSKELDDDFDYELGLGWKIISNVLRSSRLKSISSSRYCKHTITTTTAPKILKMVNHNIYVLYRAPLTNFKTMV